MQAHNTGATHVGKNALFLPQQIIGLTQASRPHDSLSLPVSPVFACVNAKII